MSQALDAVDEEGAGLTGKLAAVRVISDAISQSEWTFPEGFVPVPYRSPSAIAIAPEHAATAVRFEALSAANLIAWAAVDMTVEEDPLDDRTKAVAIGTFHAIRAVALSTLGDLGELTIDRNSLGKTGLFELLDAVIAITEMALVRWQREEVRG